MVTSHESRRHERGFTFVELLIVIGIMAVLAGLVLAALQSSQKKSRDTARRNDVRQIGLAVSNFGATYGPVPIRTTDSNANTLTELQTAGFLTIFPTPPNDTDHYHYISDGAGTQFGLCTNLESNGKMVRQSRNAQVELNPGACTPAD